MSKANNDPLVVRTADLRPFIERTILQFNNDHPLYEGQAVVETVEFGVWNWMEQETGIPKRSLYRIYLLETKSTSLETADKLLQGLGYPQALQNGEVKIIPNPQWSMVGWVAYMRERGCEPEDFLE